MNNEIATVAKSQVFNLFDKEQFEVVMRVCKMLATSDLVPDMYKINLAPDKNGNPTNPENKAIANSMIAIEIASRIGASPLMVMQNMTPIYGKPSWSSKFLIATVNSCGRFRPLQFRFTNLGKLGKVNYTTYDKEWITNPNGKGGYYKKTSKVVTFDGANIDNIQCVAYTTAKGSTDELCSSEVDIRMAVTEGWYTKDGSKWPNMTKQMLTYRAASFWTSAYAPELSMGIRTSEEVIDTLDVEFEDVTKGNDAPTPPKSAENANTVPIKDDITPEGNGPTGAQQPTQPEEPQAPPPVTDPY